MPSGERINSSPETNTAGEVANQTPRSTYEARGEKANQSVINETEPAPEAEAEKLKISDLSLEDLLTLDISRYSERELLEAKARLEEERKALLSLEENTKAQTATSQPEISEPETPQPEVDQPATAATIETSAPAAIPEPELKDTSGIDIVVADTPDAELEVEEEFVDSAAETVPIIPPINVERIERIETISPEEARATFEKAKKKSRVREFFNKTATKVVAGVMAFIIVTGGAFHVANLVKANQDQPQQPGIEQVVDQDDKADEADKEQGSTFEHVSDKQNDQDKNTNHSENRTGTQASEQAKASESNPISGELSNGTHYNYSEYADRDHKESYNAFGYDASDCFNDIEKSKAGILKKASDYPEALAAYSYGFFNETEKAELGISGMKATDIDNYISHNADGGAMQKRLLTAFEQGLNDKSTGYNFYHEDDTEQTDYIYFVDDNNDGRMDPSEMHLAYDIRDRNGAPQLDISRDGNKVLDLNLSCGWQTNYEPGHAPDGVPHVPADAVTDHEDPGTGSEGTGNEGTGNEGTGTEGTGSEGNEDTGSEDTGDEGTGNEGTGTEGTGSEGNEDTGSEDTGNEGTGSEDTGEEDTGSEDTGEEDTGSEDTGEEDTGSEDTGEEDTGSEDTGEEDTGSEDTGEEDTGSEDTGDEGTDIEQKDYENMERIDNNAEDQGAEEHGTDEIDSHQMDADQNDITEQPSEDDYQGTEADIVQNEPSQEAEPVQDQISDTNNYSQDQGGAHDDEYRGTEADEAGQAEADANAIPNDELPNQDSQGADDILGELGIS